MNHGEGNGEWYPIDGLFRPDGDTDMVFLSANNIIYTDEINDDWYSAHQTPNADFDVVSPGGDDSRGGVNYYMSDEPASVLGCKLQYQACKPGVSSQDGCSRLGGILDLANGYLASPEEQQILSWMWPYPWSVDDVITFLQISSLASRLNLEQGIQGQLPDDQWQIDVENWHNINLAHLQGRMIDQAAGPDDEGILNCCWKRPETDVESHFCKNQVRAFWFDNRAFHANLKVENRVDRLQQFLTPVAVNHFDHRRPHYHDRFFSSLHYFLGRKAAQDL